MVNPFDLQSATNPEEVLTKLRDIHMPPPVSMWPPGPGYYALAALIIVGLLMLLYWLKRRQATAAKRQALAILDKLQAEYEQASGSIRVQQTQSTAIAITALLKRIALLYYPREDVAGLHGTAWLLFLEQKSKQLNFHDVKAAMLEAPFKPNADIPLTPLFELARHWIKQRRRPCSS